MSDHLKLTLKIWRQSSSKETGAFESYVVNDISPEMSFLEMLDTLNEKLILEGKQAPIEFDNDCREGICGMCSLVINGVAHGPRRATATCQLHMRSFKNNDTIYVEPFRAEAFPVVRDLVVDRSAFDRIIEAGGYNSVNTGSAPDANAVLVPKTNAEAAMDAAACIGCGACVAACPNASAALFTAAKISHLALLPQGRPEAASRVKAMVAQMDAEGFGNCSNIGECEAVCPKEISLGNIARMRREFAKAML